MNKLYKVKTQGIGDYYVCSKDAGSAYLRVRKYLDDKDFGFSKDREMDAVILIAEGYKDYPECGTRLLFDN